METRTTTPVPPSASVPASRASLRTDTMPWYRQFWPWFVIALPAVSVVFSMATLLVAVRDADSLVRDDWYDAGVTINRDFDREHAAAGRGLGAELRLDSGETLVVVLTGAGAADVTELRLQMSWPSSAARDQLVDLVAASPGRFVPRTPVGDLAGRWDVALTPTDSAWRLAGRVELSAGRAAAVTAGDGANVVVSTAGEATRERGGQASGGPTAGQ